MAKNPDCKVRCGHRMPRLTVDFLALMSVVSQALTHPFAFCEEGRIICTIFLYYFLPPSASLTTDQQHGQHDPESLHPLESGPGNKQAASMSFVLVYDLETFGSQFILANI